MLAGPLGSIKRLRVASLAGTLAIGMLLCKLIDLNVVQNVQTEGMHPTSKLQQD